ncbi:MAG: Cof-type HAD-IIB family hydrolase [Lachnospiraceae bacterium]|nr:Cof-type HAD-IIB family hydrolase [Lachnospiraceae bacterium]
MNIVDLHVHSNRSDGTFSPSELVDYAIQKGLSAFALTDHDTVDGLDEALSRAAALKTSENTIPEVIPGIELSTEYEGKDVHIVGLYIDHHNPTFLARLREFVDSRTVRNEKMCGRLRETGIDISYEKLQKAFPDSVITRAHYAKWMLENGYIKNLQEAFDRYVGDNCPCYVPREKITPAQAVELILSADGIPVLAHPTLYYLNRQRLKKLVMELKEAGLLALEGIYSTYSPAEERQMRTLASECGLLISGGSDFHGGNKPGLDLATGYGRLFIPQEVLDHLKACRGKVLFSDMDGTLLLNDSTVSDRMRRGIAEFTQAGNHLILTSGRPLPSVLEVKNAQKLNLPGCSIIITYNGALVYDCAAQKPLLCHRLSLEDVRYVSEQAQKWNLHIHTYSDTHIIAREYNRELEYYTSRIHLPIQYADDLACALTQPPCKIQCICLDDRQRLEAFRRHLLPHLGDRVNIMFSNDKYLELLPKDASKGKAIQFVRQYLHLPVSHSYAAGDEENDISMLQAAGCGIAMANATEDVKKAAGIITANDNDHDGLLEIFQSL